MIARWLRLLVVVFVCVLGGGLVFGGASALAAGEHVFSGSFGGPGSVPGKFSEPSGVAVNEEAEDVYVVDKGNNRVEEFNSSGSTLLGEFNGAAAPTGPLSAPEGIAVDNSSDPLDPSRGDVYVVDTGHEVIDKFSASGVYEGQLSKGAGGAPLEELDGVAVDPQGAVWVYQRRLSEPNQGSGEVDNYSNALGNAFLASRLSPFGANKGFAVDSEDNLYVNRFSKIFAKLNSAGEELIGELDGEEASGASVNEFNGGVFVDNVGHVAQYGLTGEFVESFGGGNLTAGTGIAVNAGRNTVYVADSATSTVAVFAGPILPIVTTGEAAGFGVEGHATLAGTVNPEGMALTTCEFEYGSEAAYGQTAPCTTTPSGSSPVAVSAEVTGLTPGSGYHFRLVAGNANGSEHGRDQRFFASARPRITGEYASGIASDSATLNASINPEALASVYRLEYGTSTAYGSSVPVPDASIGAGLAAVQVSQHIGGLQASTTYHWRVVAHNSNGTTTGGDHTFIYSTAGRGLPDGRAYEMVTPAQKNGALIDDVPFSVHPNDIAEDGSWVDLPVVQCFGDANSCPVNRGSVGAMYAFTRGGDGWAASALAPPVALFDSISPVLVSANVGALLFNAATPPAREDDFYARGPDGSIADIGPLTPPAAGALGPNVEYPMATADLSHVVYQAFLGGISGDSNRWPFDATTGSSSVYEYVGTGNSQPTLIGVSGGAGSTSLISQCDTVLPAIEGPGVLSRDGSTVFFKAAQCATGSGANAGVPVPAETLYARIDGSRTVLISGRSPGDCATPACLGSPASTASFAGASADGSKAFFMSTQQLTDSASEDSHSGDGASSAESCSATTGANGCNLYEYDFGSPTGHNLVALSAGDSSGDGPRVQGVTAVSADGSHIYFVAKGVLSGVANSRGQSAQDGAENLYVFERDAAHPEGHLAFVATLAASDGRDLGKPGDLADRMPNVTPDGRFLVFTSSGRLTADDTSTTGAKQVFRYDAQTETLARISIGERGFNDNGNAGIEDARIAVVRFLRASGPVRRDPTMSHDGAYVFFESPVALTPGALDHVQVGEDLFETPAYAENVYEYHEGHVYLISGGHDVSDSSSESCETHSSVCLYGTDATGSNVFFTTTSSLVAQDTNTQLDLYDARICTPDSPCVAPPVSAPACQGEACHGAPSGAPSLPSAASTLFSGPGNLSFAPAAPKAKTKVKRKTRHKAKRKKAKRRRAKRSRQARRNGHSKVRG